MKDWGQSQKRSTANEKTFKAFDYTPKKSASHLIEKNFFIEDKNMDISPDKLHADSEKKLDEKKFVPENENWRLSDKKNTRFDVNSDISKKYKGKIDIEKRSVFDTDYLRHVYEDMQERSMQDINRYQFRRSHPTDPGLKTVQAGSSARDDNSSFLDHFSTRKKIQIETPTPSFRGNANAHSAKSATKAQTATKINTPATPVYNNPLMQKANSVQSGKVKAIEYIDAEKSNKYDFLKVPKGMKPKGKAIIKVETE